MGKTTPFFSIVYPTKNRPFLIEYCIKACLNQSFYDFEVIICDNSNNDETWFVTKKYKNDKRIKYFRTSTDVPMSENWELAQSKSIGSYVTVLTDKTILYKNCLKISYDYLKHRKVDVISWRNDAYHLVDENSVMMSGYDKGYFVKNHRKSSPIVIDSFNEIERNFSMSKRRGTEIEKYYLGKICFGFYSRTLVDKIIKYEGTLFEGISPDYSSKFRALSYTDSIVDLGVSLQLSIQTTISNGGNNSRNAYRCRDFICTYKSKNYLDKLPIPNLYASLHNVVAFDFFSSSKTKDLSLNDFNFILRVLEDIYETSFISKSEKREQLKLIENKKKDFKLIQKLNLAYHVQYFRVKRIYFKTRSYLGKIKKRLDPPTIYDDVIELLAQLEN